MSKNHIFLLGALLFTLSALPGFSRSAEVQSISLSSDGRPCDLREQLADGDQANCDIAEMNIDGRKVKGYVTAKKDKRVAKKKWGDDSSAAAEEQEVVDLEIHTETECTTGCLNGRREGAPSVITVTKKEAANIEAVVKRQFEAEAKKLVQTAKAEAKRQEQIEQCLIDDSGEKIEERDRMSCRMDKFENLDEKKKESYYDKYLKADLQNMLSSTSPAQRAQAMEMIKKLAQNVGESAFLKESLTEMAKYGAAHNLADTILAMNPNDPRRPFLLQQWASMQKYFEARGMQVNSQYAGVLSSWQMDSVTQDLTKYQQELTNIAEQHRQQLANNSSVPLRNGAQPIGTPGRTMFGQPSTSYLGAPGTTQAPGVLQPQRPGAPAAGGRDARGIPIPGARVN